MFTTNTWIIIKKTAARYNNVYQATIYWYKCEISNKLTLKIEHITFLKTWSILKTLKTFLKIDKTHTKTLVFATSDILKLKKLMAMKIFTV